MIEEHEGVWQIHGAVTMDTASALLLEAEVIWQAEGVRVDLAGVSDADSAAVAVLLAWRRRAKQLGKKIDFLNATESVRSLATLYDVSPLLFPEQ